MPCCCVDVILLEVLERVQDGYLLDKHVTRDDAVDIVVFIRRGRGKKNTNRRGREEDL